MKISFDNPLVAPSGAMGKDFRAYTDRAYDKNREVLANSPFQNKDQFYNTMSSVYDDMRKENALEIRKGGEGKNITFRDVLKRLGRHVSLTTFEDRLARNVVSGLKKHHLFNQFKRMVGVSSQYDLDVEKFAYIGDNTYIYENVRIELNNSPDEVTISYFKDPMELKFMAAKERKTYIAEETERLVKKEREAAAQRKAERRGEFYNY